MEMSLTEHMRSLLVWYLLKSDLRPLSVIPAASCVHTRSGRAENPLLVCLACSTVSRSVPCEPVCPTALSLGWLHPPPPTQKVRRLNPSHTHTHVGKNTPNTTNATCAAAPFLSHCLTNMGLTL